MPNLLRQFRDFFTSLQLTVALLILSLVLVFVATLDQVNLGIWAVQEKYFRSFFVLWKPAGTNFALPVFPGGYFIGGLLLINLIAAHIYRFAFTWRKLGIQLAHGGIILLLLGELITGLLQKDSSMRLTEGETKQYSESFRDNELVLLDKSNPDYDEVVAIPEAVLADQGTVQHAKLPFQVRIRAYFPNATMQMGAPVPVTPGGAVATQGIGARLTLQPLPITYKPNERNLPAALVEIVGPQGSLGTWLASPMIGMPQTFRFEDKTWELALRFKRFYKPFAVTLLKFSHDRYPGTDIPKNFSSRVRVKSDDGRDDREVLIYMNNPLRTGGFTFYQAGYDGERTTVLQVVRNPGWLLPYIACILMGLGLVLHFGQSLAAFIRKRAHAAPTP